MSDDETYDFSNDPLNNWLLHHQNMIKYVEITSITSKNKNEINDNLLPQTIARLEKMINETIIPSKPEKPYIREISHGLSDESTSYAHYHFYLQNKIYNQRIKTYNDIIHSMDELLSALKQVARKTRQVIIKINEQSIYWQLLNDDRKVIQLNSRDSDYISKITSLELSISDFSSQKSILRNIIFSMKAVFDRTKHCIIPENPYQERLNQLLFSNNFIFADQIRDIMNISLQKDPHVFSDEIVQLIKNISEEFEITDENEQNIILWTTFRSIFNACIQSNPDYFFRNEEPHFRPKSESITIDQIAVKKEFLPPHEDGDSVRVIVSKSKKLTEAAEKINSSAYMTSPFDVMDRIYSALSDIKVYAFDASTEKNRDDASTFDCVFGLFLLVLHSCDLPNVEEVFSFVQNFSPITALTSQLEYANMTISAALVQCKKLSN
ncbi:hypothetical protein TVAG_386280 [Trichomonas vaginalis G3]|uniref:VPS9 domain-containing protein n=1 Tax=Trichomonas vaginalis (strain ATCC PRA-98 / G3) TaxID=412133 RepID=A2G4P6_TRIV3|nr:VPS9 domain family [Trichomonas vaginalis G3]EAX87867.1 hypothetical protein TVAG_386280 [Trichomonas vaginalis G3]KAI5547550.1 VPS9 domain family [Trichomonas vaginalis G3]|eukprot:XP_001300797.1 hypothetical protein [Trichomonas vaginalis G3]